MQISKNAVWVFDLDDTLYPEREYQISGYEHIASQIDKLYSKDISDTISYADLNGLDVFDEICCALKLPSSFKESLLWMYRLHKPNISLSDDVIETLDFIKKHSRDIHILTDGRSISQRYKLSCLGLLNLKPFISEEWSDLKPGSIRFETIQNKFTDISQFVYVGDNLNKDFVTPNKMQWQTICIKDKGINIHPQIVDDVSEEYLPALWVSRFNELKGLVC